MKLFVIFLISFNAFGATKVNDCGMYEIYGEVKKNNDMKAYDFIVNIGSISEYKFHLSSEQEKRVISYLGHDLKIKAKILKLSSDYQGKLSSIESVEYLVPDPANLEGKKGFKLLKKEKCK